jgi:hypothetical protein
MRTLLMLALLLAAGARTAATQSGPAHPADAPQGLRNPRELRAAELLTRREPGVAARVRFAWDAVPGARGYVLAGRWTDADTWVLRSLEFRVAPDNAAEWTGRQVAFDLTLPAGSHSWTVVAVHGPAGAGDFARPARVAFDLEER